jgi:hypothetical protein
MTSLAITEGWTMASGGHRGGRASGAWRDVIVAWTVAMLLAGALLLSIPHHDRQDVPLNLWPLSPAAGNHIHKKVFDAEGPTGDEACSDRDYVNERC